MALSNPSLDRTGDAVAKARENDNLVSWNAL